jgi:Leucine-rich repeat (LRR) protein
MNRAMKTKYLKIVIAALLITAASCGHRKTVSPQENIMTIASNGAIASFALEGTGTVTIDWGDGSENETAEIWKQEEEGSPLFFTYREYPAAKARTTFDKPSRTTVGEPSRTITVSGGNITGLYCPGNEYITSLDVSQLTALRTLHCQSNQLTSLDLSKNKALKELNCFNNQFTIAALNALVGTLHENGGEIDISQNPGAAGFDASIAEAKGWVVRNE